MFPESRRHNNSITKTETIIKHNGPLFSEDLHEWTNKGVYNQNLDFLNILQTDPNLDVIEDSSLDQFQNQYARQLALKLAYLFWNVGYEAGEIKRIFQDSNISWGYFIDHNPFEPHCNAHPNNFAVNPYNIRLLEPLDFDMSFTLAEFVNTVDEASLGQPDVSLFQNWVNCERVNLELALAGQENMANFNYSENAESSILEIAYRDLLILGYRDGFELKPNRFSTNLAELSDIQRICLEFTKFVDKY